jgi:hypothetical protein
VLDEGVVALFGGQGVGALTVGLAQQPAGAEEKRDLLADGLHRRRPDHVRPLRALPPDQVEGAGGRRGGATIRPER